ncbi:MAG TPA: type II toxin-antitoxin system Phd/YefM family antitoxin [Anaerolineae bacterium]|nr:type II toxin-antitoxin system Phd/YefM family antitoxin [Anaerolineae bacterium]
MTVTTLTSTDLRDRLASVLRQLREHPEPVVITERGRAEAVLLSIDQYESMIDLLEDREDEVDAQLGRRIREERESYARGEGRDFQALLPEVDA